MAYKDLKVEVSDFLPEFTKLAKAVNFRETFPHTLAALNIMAHRAFVVWRKATMGEQLPGMPFPIWSRGDYTRSIGVDISNEELKYVYGKRLTTEGLEEGHGEIDLKPGLLSGPKARQGKFGPYNIVSFRHGVPGTSPSNNPMPASSYSFINKQAKQADQAYQAGHSSKPGTSSVTGYSPKPVNLTKGRGIGSIRSYNWGSKLPESLGGVAQTKKTSKGDYSWTTGKRTGMVKMEAGAGGTTNYRTFRVVSYKSDPASWIVPPREANPIRQSVLNSLSDEFKDLLKSAMEEDIQ